MDNFNSDKYYETLLNNFAKNYQYYQYYLNLKIKTKNYIKKKNNKKVSWDEENLINIYYYSNNK